MPIIIYSVTKNTVFFLSNILHLSKIVNIMIIQRCVYFFYLSSLFEAVKILKFLTSIYFIGT